MDALNTPAFRMTLQRLLPGLLLAISGSALAAPIPPPPPPPDPNAPAQEGQMRPPQYPVGENGVRGSGVVVLILTIADDGTVTKVELEKSSGFQELDTAAMEAAATWNMHRNMPPERRIVGRVRVPVNFSPD